MYSHRRPPEDALISYEQRAETIDARRQAIRAVTEKYGPQVAAWWIANALGMTQAEIGAMSGCHPRTVRRYIRRFREKLGEVYRRAD